jgi:hypothetical protein
VGGDANNVRFTLNIHQDIPAHLSHTNYSQPGDVLWSQTFWPGDFSVWKQNADVESFYHPYSNWYIPNNHWDVYKYKIPINNQKAFHQTGTTQTPVVYWLSVQAYLVHQPGTRATRWGWKTSTKEWNDVPVYANTTDPNNADWKALSYPNQHAYYGRKPGLAFRVTTSDKSEDLTVHYQVADDWLCDSRNPITATTWWGSYVGYNYNVCACQEQPTPQKPLYFWLSIWTDIPDPWPADVTTFSKPSKLVWEYQAYDYDEVLVGFDNAPQDPSYTVKHEAVYRYSMRFPKKYWFYQPAAKQVYWFSVVAVYPDLTTIPYKWGWTNHKHVYNDNAVTSLFPYNPPTWDNIFWSPLYDRISAKEDMSFMLYTDPNEYPND